MHISVGSNRLYCIVDAATPMDSIAAIEIHLKHTISTHAARHCTLDMKGLH